MGDLPGLFEVPQVIIPVGQSVYETYKDTLAIPGSPPITHELALNGMKVRGRWHVVALRADYALGERTFWITLAWAGDY